MTMSWLPVPLRPMTSQLGSIRTREAGITAMRGSAPPASPSPTIPAPIRVAPVQPLTNFQRPFKT